MATLKMTGVDGYLEQLNQLGNAYDSIIPQMVNAGAEVVRNRMKQANEKFARFLTIKKAKKNEFGWFAKVEFKGNTSSGAFAGLAAAITEYGRNAGTYKDRQGHERKYPAQPATPWIRAAISAAEAETYAAMEAKHDEEVKKIMG